MSRKVLAFVPQHTTTKSRIMAIVDKGNGMEIDAIATIDRPHDAVAICNIFNCSDDGHEEISGLWHSLPDSVKASLRQARDERVGDDDERHVLAPAFITELDIPAVPKPHADIDWAKLFPAAQCPDDGCDLCDGCPGHAKTRGEDPGANQCAPGGSCHCHSEDLGDDEEPCACGLWDVGPRWAAALYESLAGTTEVLIEHAENMMWGIDEGSVGFPRSLVDQPPQFFVRLARACVALCDELAHGRVPVPHTIAELLMLDEAARSFLADASGANGLDVDTIREVYGHLPEAHGDFELEALWMFQFSDSDWVEIAEAETVYKSGSMDRIFDTLPEAAEWPRPEAS